MEFWDFYELERLSKKSEKFLKYIEQLIDSGYSLLQILDVIKVSGICFNPYSPNETNSLLDQVLHNLKQRFAEESTVIDNFFNEVSTLRSLFTNFTEERDSSILKKVPPKRRLSSFILALEMWLGAQQEYTLRKSSFYSIKKVYPFIVALADKSKEQFLPIEQGQEYSGMIYESIVENASSVIRYLQLENGELNTTQTPSMNDVRSAREHILYFEKFSSLLSIEQKWRFSNTKLNRNGDEYYIENDTNDFIKTVETSKIRFKSQKIIWAAKFSNMEIKNSNPGNTLLPPEEFICQDEALYSITLMEFLHKNDLKTSCLDVFLSEWIRAYTIIKLLSIEELENRFSAKKVRPLSLEKWTLKFTRTELLKLFIDKGISKNSSEIIINTLTFSRKSKDLLDCPLIEDGKNLFFIPSIGSVIDPASSIISLLSKNQGDISFKGHGFENEILSKFQKNGISASRIKENDHGDTYESDVIFKLGEDLFITELKAFGQPTTLKDYYNLMIKLIGPKQRIKKDDKKRSAIDQLNRAASFYESHLQMINAELKLKEDWTPNNIYKIVLTTAMLGEPLFKDNTFFIDQSVFFKFLDRSGPSFLIKNREYKYPSPNFDGEITTKKLLNVLSSPPQLEFADRKLRTIGSKFEVNNKNVHTTGLYDVYGDIIIADIETLKKLGLEDNEIAALLKE